MEKKVEEIIICAGCIGKNYDAEYDLEDLMVQVETRLQQAHPDKEWNITNQSCFRFCPKDRITISVSERMTMTKAATVDSIVTEVLSFYKN